MVNYPSSTISETFCNIACAGNPLVDLICGGSGVISIYTTNSTVNASTFRANLNECPRSNFKEKCY